MSRLVGAALDPDVETDIEIASKTELSSGVEAGFDDVQPTQPPHSLLELGTTKSHISSSAGTSGFPDLRERISGIHGSIMGDDVT